MIFFSPRELKSLKAGATPSRDFKAGLKKELFAAYDARYGTARGMSPFMKYSAVGMCAFTLLFGMGTGVYAYSSPDVVEGDTLYPVKSGIEQVEGAMAFTPDQKARYHAKMMQRRVQEAEHLQGRPEVAQHLAEQAAGEVGDDGR